MKFLKEKTRVQFYRDDVLYEADIDTIMINSDLWLVGSWFEQISTGDEEPDVLVRLTGLPYEVVRQPTHLYVLHTPLPNGVLDGKDAEGFVVWRWPTIQNIPPAPGVH